MCYAHVLVYVSAHVCVQNPEKGIRSFGAICVFSKHLTYFMGAGIWILVLMIIQKALLTVESFLLPIELSLTWF